MHFHWFHCTIGDSVERRESLAGGCHHGNRRPRPEISAVARKRTSYTSPLRFFWLLCSLRVFLQQSAAHALSSSSTGHSSLRLNKVFKATHSRRQADTLIQEGRVTVNGEVSTGCMVVPFQDQVRLDGELVTGWEAMNGLVEAEATKGEPRDNACTGSNPQTYNNNSSSPRKLEYIKYYKPRSVICTTDPKIKGNLIHALTKQSGYTPKHRVYPVGRLDKDTSGLILVTSDGRLPNASLRSNQRQSKVYQVQVDMPLRPSHVQKLRDGVVITTVAQRDGKRAEPLTARTKRCLVRQFSPTMVEMTLQEGRNRQIRKMMGALGYTVRRLHRVQFGEITLDGLEQPGDWKYLNDDEMKWIRRLVEQNQKLM